MLKRTLVILSCMTVVILVVAASVAEAQRGGGGRGAGGRGGFNFGTRGGPLGLVSRSEVQEELGLTDDQISEIEQISENARGAGRRQFEGFQRFAEMSEDERREAMADMRKRAEKQQAELRDQVAKILTSDQRSRFAELEFQYQLERGQVRAALLAAGIDLDEDDTAKLTKAAEEVQARTEAEIAKIRRDARREILGAVVSDSQIDRMAGEKFEFAANERGPFGAGRGGGTGRAGRAGRDRQRPSGEDEEPAGNDEGGGRRRRR